MRIQHTQYRRSVRLAPTGRMMVGLRNTFVEPAKIDRKQRTITYAKSADTAQKERNKMKGLTKKDEPNKIEQQENRMTAMDQELQRTAKMVARLERTVEALEAALRTDYSDRGGAALCPSCEEAAVVKGDYLCSDCRHG